MKKILVLMLVFWSLTGFAQKKKIEGNLSFLKNEKSVKTEFDYSNMAVGKFPKEEDYIKKRKAELNEKEIGRGDKFEKDWFDARKDRYEPQFRELFSKHAERSSIGDGAKYRMLVKTTFTEPGWNAGVMRVPATINIEVLFYELTKPEDIVAKIIMTKVPGQDVMGFDYDPAIRLQEAYSKAGKEVGQLIVKENK